MAWRSARWWVSSLMGKCCRVLLDQKEVGFKVELSNKDGEFLHTFRAFLRSGDAPTIKFVEFVKKEDCLAVHLADFWAMYSRRLSPLVRGLNGQTLPDIPTPLKAAFNYVPHALDNVTGMASVFARDRRKIQVGTSSTTWFGPAARMQPPRP